MVSARCSTQVRARCHRHVSITAHFTHVWHGCSTQVRARCGRRAFQLEDSSRSICSRLAQDDQRAVPNGLTHVAPRQSGTWLMGCQCMLVAAIVCSISTSGRLICVSCIVAQRSNFITTSESPCLGNHVSLLCCNLLCIYSSLCPYAIWKLNNSGRTHG
jgi:hypothetical protein